MMVDSFSGFHPLINILFFAAALTFTMAFTHPVCLAISFICSLAYSIYINRGKAIRFGLIFLLPALIMTALLNPLFNHRGATILLYFRSGNPLTLESIYYGAASAVMLSGAVSWFSCVNAVITSDKIVYLFGRAAPAVSLLLSMSLRLVPRFISQAKIISGAQKAAGFGVSDGGLIKRARNGISILSILITWALENAIDTADSMKSRGYGLPGRTAFSIYRFGKRDRTALVFMLACVVFVIAGAVRGAFYFRYFPTVKGGPASLWQTGAFIVLFVLCIAPVVINLYEDFKWKASESNR